MPPARIQNGMAASLFCVALAAALSLSHTMEAHGALSPMVDAVEHATLRDNGTGLAERIKSRGIEVAAQASIAPEPQLPAERIERILRLGQAASKARVLANRRELVSDRRIHPDKPAAEDRAVAAGRAMEFYPRQEGKAPRNLRGKNLQPAEKGPWTGEERDKRTARAFLRAHRYTLKLRDPDKEMRLDKVQHDELGHRHIRFRQTHRGVPLWANGLIVQLDKEGNAVSMHGAYSPSPSSKLITRPTVQVAASVAQARAAVEGGEHAQVPEPELVIHAPLRGMSRLAWKVEVNVSDHARWQVFVDAASGKVLSTHSLVCEAATVGSGLDLFGVKRSLNVWKDGTTFGMVDTSKNMYDPASTPPDPDQTRGAIFVLDAANQAPDADGNIDLGLASSGNANAWSVKDAVSASFNLSLTYDYYKDKHDRDSLDGANGTIYGVVRYRQEAGQPMANAFWNGAAMFFGTAEPYAGATDVVGHELTHGVVTHSADLVYKNQSGALNEAFADIFGEMVEARAKGGRPDWLIGGPPLRTADKALRDFINPNNVSCSLAPCPAKMSQYIRTQQDNGGVHLNSSIINHAYYLLAEGLPGAIGIADAERIFYRALTTKLSPQSEFIDLRHGATASAKELFGDTSTQAAKVAAAFDAVEIADAPTTPPPPPTTVVSGPDASLFNYYYPDYGYYLARRETTGDGTAGSFLSHYAIRAAKPSISGDGTLAAFVDAYNDVCFIATDGSAEEECVGYAGWAHSVALSRDQNQLAFVMLDEQGYPDNTITILNLITEEAQTYTLKAPLLDGGTINVLQADMMEFTGDGKGLVYDAYNELSFTSGATLGLWSVYKLDIASGQVVTVIPPIEGFDIGNPSLGKTGDHLLTFEVIDGAAGQSTVFTANTFTGDLVEIITMEPGPLLASPSFTGNDRGLVFAYPDAYAYTGSSCWRQALAADKITPTSADPTLWVDDGALCTVYRRGTYTPPKYYELTVVKAGTGTGVVTSVPEGISCGTACNVSQLKDTQISLTAKASDGSVFAGWSGNADCSDGKISLGANKTCTATFNLDASKPTVTVTATDASATEAGLTTGKFIISRTGSTAAALTVNFTVTGTATAGSDYAGLGASVTIPAGSTSVVKAVTPLQDTLQEINETIVLTLKPATTYAVGAGSSATVTLTSDDTVTRTVTVTATDAFATESGPTTGKFTITRTGDTSASLTVNFAVSGTATAGSDYTGLGTSVVIPAGKASVFKTVTPMQDTLQELDETITLTLKQSASYAVGAAGSATVTLASDEAVTQTVTVAATDASATEAGLTTGKITFTRSGDIAAALTVNYAVSGTATAGSDYAGLGVSVTFQAGKTTATKTVTPKQDTLAEGNETVILTLKQSPNYAVGPANKATVTLSSDD